MKQLKNWTIGLAAFAVAAGVAVADGWYRVGDVPAGGAKEITANFQDVQAVRIQGLEGNVTVQTLWVRNGGQRDEFPVGRSLGKDEIHEIELGGRTITGFRVLDSGSGRYAIDVLADESVYYSTHHHHHHHHHPHPGPLDGEPGALTIGDRQPEHGHKLPPPDEKGVAPVEPRPTKAPATKPSTKPVETKPAAPKPTPKPAPKKAPPRAPKGGPKGR
jgi:hypothetical protein